MEAQTQTMEVIVHKAGIPLMKGETLSQFTRALRESGESHLMRKLNLNKDKDSVFMVETMSDKVVFDVFRPQATGGSRIKFFAVKFSRDTKTGSFDFGESIEVRRVTTFEPIPGGTGASADLKTKKVTKAVELSPDDTAFVPVMKRLAAKRAAVTKGLSEGWEVAS